MSPKSSSSSSSSTSSSSDSSSDIEEKLEKLVVKEETEINILLLGETGVGKSTFINSFANYLSIKYFDDAEKKGLVKLIPAVYKIRDKDNKEHEIKLGSQKDENECLQIGESATQNVKTYVFPVWKGRVKVRLIDTPGMGDTRGVEQDEKNCENIINYIKKLEKIHAVCFLCKPTNARKTVYFDYCVYQILSHLESDAAKNIFFLFTNTRGSNYGPGDTFLTLKAIIKNVEDSTGVQIPLEKNMYCFDNEGFKFLGAHEKNVQFDQSTRNTYKESWAQSAKTCWNFVNHLQKNIQPYVPSKLLDVNFAKRTLFKVCKVLGEISEVMADTKIVMQRMEENKNKHLQTISELKKEITRITDVVVQQWSQPILVCTSIPSCAEVYKINGVNKTHYKNACHYCFDLDKSRIQLFITGSPDVTKCENIDNTDRKCRQCGCDFLLHMHIDYTTSLQENLVVDNDAAHHIAIKESLINDNKEICESIQMQIDRSQEEYDEIKKLCVNLSRYLKEHAIVVFSVSYKSYVEYLINQKQSSGTSSVSTSIDDLRKLKDEYEVAQRAFEEYLKSPLSSTENFNFEMEDEHFKHFFQLSENGKKIEDAYFQQKKLASTDFNVKEYVHGHFYVKEHDKKRNQKSGGNNDHDNRDRPGGARTYAKPKPYDRQHSNYQHPQGRGHPAGPGHPPGPYRASQPYPPNYNTDSNYYQGQHPPQSYGQHPSQSYGQHPFQSYRHPPPLLGHHPPPLLGQHPPPFGGYPQEASGNYGYNPNYAQPYSEGYPHGAHQQNQQDANRNDGIRTHYRDRRNDNKNNRGGKRNDDNQTEEDNSDSDDSQCSSRSRKNDGNRNRGGNRKNNNQRKVDNKRNDRKRSNSRGRRNDRNKEDNRDSDDSQHSSVSKKNEGNTRHDNNQSHVYNKRNGGNRGNYRGRRNYGDRTKEDNRDSDDSQHSSVSRNNDNNRKNDGNRGNHRGHFRPHRGRRNYNDRNSGESRNSSVDRKNDGNRNKEDNRDSDDSQVSSVSRKSDGNQSKNANKKNDGNRGRYQGNYRGRGNYGNRNKEDNKDNDSQDSFVFLGNRNNGNRANFRGPYRGRGRGRGNYGDSNKEDNSQNSFVFLGKSNDSNRGTYRDRRNNGDNPNGIHFDSSGSQSKPGGLLNSGNQSNPSGTTSNLTSIRTASSQGNHSGTIRKLKIINTTTSIQSNPSSKNSNLTSIRTASNQSNPSYTTSNLTSIRTASNQSNPSSNRNYGNQGIQQGLTTYSNSSNTVTIRQVTNPTNVSSVRSSNYSSPRYSGNPTTFTQKKKSDDSCNLM